MCSSEAHLDLHCWMATLYHTISRIALKLGYTEDFAKFSSRAKDIQAKINGNFLQHLFLKALLISEYCLRNILGFRC